MEVTGNRPLIPTDRVVPADVSSPKTADQAEGNLERADSPGPRNITLERQPTLNLSNKDRNDEERTRRLLEDERGAEFADKIATEIKLHYLRSTFATDAEHNSRDQQSAVRFLHGANTESKASIEFHNNPNKLFEEQLIIAL